ncbi:hypothetical protein BSI_05520 [Bacillus inaquosorum KCTC 13429]|uniref:Uncharacterized protein n=1 Tax=Bacillus inaquosorum KCTC 13429 TaxID=1236548 RepID=A0A9W5LM14_9BACI|nr:hypothetical protein BSI_05520 [Bacillus inaquosorum KCTC 13429]
MLKKFHFFPNLPQNNISASAFENETLYLQGQEWKVSS